MKQISSFVTICTASFWIAAFTPAYATVISIDSSGRVQVQEAKNYLQKGQETQNAPESTLKNPAIESENIELNEIQIDKALSPVTARIVSPENNKIESESANDVKTLDIEIKEEFEFEAIPYASIIAEEVAKHNIIDMPLIEAVIEAESNFNPQALSPKGAMGLMQLMPATAEKYNVVNAFDPSENIKAGTAELARLMDVYDNTSLALAAYNAGEQAVNKYDGIPPYEETQNYVVKILSKVFIKREDIAKSQSLLKELIKDDVKNNKTDTISKMKVYTYSFSDQ